MTTGVPLLTPSEIRALATELGVRPSKSRGQNFVHDANTVRRIVAAAGVDPGERVLEIGPGLGSLTLALLGVGADVTAVEIEPAFAARLPHTVAERGVAAERLTVLEADALRLTEVPGPPPTSLVANLPYNIAVPVTLHLLDVVPSLRHVLVMVQAEVADRMAAPPGSKVYGVPSVKVAWYAAAARAGSVPRGVFWPAPNVDSALVRLSRRDPPVVEVAGTGAPVARARVFAVVDAAFAQRRKTLRAALAGYAGSATAAETALRAAGIDPTRRGETLDVVEFTRLAAAFAASAAASTS